MSDQGTGTKVVLAGPVEVTKPVWQISLYKNIYVKTACFELRRSGYGGETRLL